MRKLSAGILLYRRRGDELELLLVHPGGPFWAKKDEGAWSIPKGEYEPPEEPLEAAVREFKEEIGFSPHGPFIELGEAVQPSRKVITAWALEADFDPKQLKSNTFSLEWPPKSGKIGVFPEVDKAEWFTTKVAKDKILHGQADFIDILVDRLDYTPPLPKGQLALF